MDLGIGKKVALVQGASSGLGYAAALELAREGAQVAICSRSEASIQAAADRITKETENEVLPIACDLNQASERRNMLHAIERQWGSVDILVANNGGPSPGYYDTLGPAQWEHAIQNNLLTMKDSMLEVLPGMQEKAWGRIVIITSISVKQPLETLILSNTARAGLTGFAKTLSSQVASQGVTINMVLPGIHNTPRVQQLADPDGFTRDIPMGRLGRPEELAAVIAFLASSRASYMTGQSIVVDGGMIKALY